MPVPTLSAIIPQDTMLITGLQYPQAVAIPTTGSPTTLLFTCLSLPGIVALVAATATTTGTQATVGAKTIVVASATSLVVGQLVVGVGIQLGTTVTAISGTTITLSNGITAALSSTTVNFIAAMHDASGGVAVTPNAPVAIVIGANTFIVYLSATGGYSGYGGYPAGAFQSQLNVVAFT